MHRVNLHGLMVAVLVASSMVLSCKGETTIKDNPETQKQLSSCESKIVEKDQYIATLEKRIEEIQANAGGNVVVTLEGEAMSIKSGGDKGPHAGSGDPKGTAKDAELYASFVAALKKSRGSIKKCYQGALKKNSALQARSVTLDIAVDYKTSGSVRNASFSPRISEQFNTCMRTVAKNWKLPAMPRAVSFNYKQTLTPE